jgi:hypothetical protein
MARIHYVHTDKGFTTHGSFESDTAERFRGREPEDPDFYATIEDLYTDDLGFWYLDRGTTGNVYEKIFDTLARQWLIDNGYPQEAKRRFDRPEGCRPSRGEKVEVWIPDWTRRRIDDMAERNELDPQEMIRRLLEMAVRAEGAIADSGVVVPRQ